jgi:hypothetical protein
MSVEPIDPDFIKIMNSRIEAMKEGSVKVIIVGTDAQISNHTMEKYNGSLDLFMGNYTKRNELKEHILKVADQTCSWFEFLRDIYAITGDDIDSVDTTQGQLYYLLSEALNELSIDELKKLIE